MINYWGMFFTFGIPVILWILGIYYAGVETGKKRKGKKII